METTQDIIPDWKASAVRLGYILASNPTGDNFRQKFIVLSAPCESALGALVALGAQAVIFKSENENTHGAENIPELFLSLNSGTKLYECPQAQGCARVIWTKLCVPDRNCGMCPLTCSDPPDGYIFLKRFTHELRRTGRDGPPCKWKTPKSMTGRFVPVDQWENREEWGVGCHPYPEDWRKETLRLAGINANSDDGIYVHSKAASMLVCCSAGISKSAQLAEEVSFSCGIQAATLKELLTTNNQNWQKHDYPSFTHIASSRGLKRGGYGMDECQVPLLIFEGFKGYRLWKNQSRSAQGAYSPHRIIILTRSGSAAEQQEKCDWLRYQTRFMKSVELDWFEKEGVIFPKGLSLLIWEEKPKEAVQW